MSSKAQSRAIWARVRRGTISRRDAEHMHRGVTVRDLPEYAHRKSRPKRKRFCVQWGRHRVKRRGVVRYCKKFAWRGGRKKSAIRRQSLATRRTRARMRRKRG